MAVSAVCDAVCTLLNISILNSPPTLPTTPPRAIALTAQRPPLEDAAPSTKHAGEVGSLTAVAGRP